MSRPPTVLHVPYTYFPDPSGGTEVYVRALVADLCRLGVRSAVAAPAAANARYCDQGVQVFRFATAPQARLEHAYGLPDETAALGFGEVLQASAPDIVHLHARTAAVSERLVDLAHEAGAKVVFTYHTPTVSCARGDLLEYGRHVCDGHVEARRCTACSLHGAGAPRPLAAALSALPRGIPARLALAPTPRRARTALAAPGLVAERCNGLQGLLGKSDRIVAVCEWVRDLLVLNGVEPAKIVLSRQGAAAGRAAPATAKPTVRGLRIGYFGRVDPTKGLDVLIAAVAACKAPGVSLDIYAVEQAGVWPPARHARGASVRFHLPVEPESVQSEMGRYDIVAVPSRGVETGPLVVLEAFAAGVPVIGARRGGIAELVRDGVDGVLAPAGDAAAWRAAIEDLAAAPERLATLRSNVLAPRGSAAVARDMQALYAALMTAEAIAGEDRE